MHALIASLPLLAFALIDPSHATISESFRLFIRETYGTETEQLIARDDIGVNGSFGGGDHVAGTKTRNIPIVYVHGIVDTAGGIKNVTDYYLQNGYGEDEVYGTTYGPTNIFNDSLKCVYVKAVRALIIAVEAYTDSQVKVVGYSMGGPISRKVCRPLTNRSDPYPFQAILGGKCVETGEELGGALTATLHTYLTVAGANHGASICFTSLIPTCNKLNGLICKSTYMNDINAQSNYESPNIYVLQSMTDTVVGYYVCGVKTTEIPGAKLIVTKFGPSHVDIFFKTAQIQYNLLNYGHE
ncbi:CBN-LIPS-7 protein [Aphelenchoides avenae]|nr:CBN-LIPS-7 protein [Aphelenchus avenae]